MKWKSTLVLLSVTVAVGAYVSLYELKQPSPEMREDLAKRVLTLVQDEVQRIAIQGPQGEVTVVRAGTDWQLETPRVRADGGVVESLLNETEWLAAERVLSGTPAQPIDPSTYDLDSPSARLTLTTKDGHETSLLFGEPTAVGPSRYLKLADRPEIFVVASSLYERLDQPTESFRDPLLIRFNSWETTELTVNAADRRFMLTRSGHDWALAQPFADRADRTEVSGLLNRVSGLRIRRFVTDAPGDAPLSTWGLDQPAPEVALVQPEPVGRITLLFGSAVADDQTLVYAKRSDEPSVYAVSSEAVAALSPDPHGLRAKVCFEFFASQVTKVEGRRGEALWVAERKDGEWREPTSGQLLDAQRVEDVLSTLADLRLSGFVEEAPGDLSRFGLDPPAGQLIVWTAEQAEPQRLVIGATIPDSTNRYGRIAGRSAVVRLPEIAAQLLDTSLEQFSPPAEPSPEEAIFDSP
jgi:hypothetical protein